MTDDSEDEIESGEDPRTQSKKIEVIEALFQKLWPDGQKRPSTPMIVTNDDVTKAIRERNARHPGEGKPLSPSNPANFLKDFIRKRTCNANWPKPLRERRITARQRYGDRQVLEFVDYAPGDDVPFPDRFDPIEGMEVLPFESLSIPIEARVLGRADEPWLIQVVVSQRLLHTHFAVVAQKFGLQVDTLAHLQTSVKTQPEIDATFVANITDAGKPNRKLRAYVTCEAKQFNERILEFQIREQVAKAFEITSALEGDEAIHTVIPTVFQVVKYPVQRPDGETVEVRGIYVVQFNMFGRQEFDSKYSKNLHDMPLSVQSRALYEAWPPIRGISATRRAPAKQRSARPTRRRRS